MRAKGHLRLLALAALAGAVAGSLRAAAPEAQLLELEEVAVTSSTPRPLEDYVEFPRYDSVAISPGGTKLAMGWTEDNYQRQISVVEFPSRRPLGVSLLPTPQGVSDLRWSGEQKLVVQPDWPLHGLRRVRVPLGSILISDMAGRNLQQINGIFFGTIDPLQDIRSEELVTSGSRALNTGRTDHPDNGKMPNRRAEGPVRLIAARTGVADQALIQTRRTDRAGNTDGYGAFQVNLQSLAQNRVAMLPLPDSRFVTGPGDAIALAAAVNARNERLLYYLPPDKRSAGKDWQLLVQAGSGERGLEPIAWSGNGEQYFALDGRNLPTRAVVMWDAANNTQRVLYRHAETDINQFALDPAGRPWVFWGNGHFPVYWYPDPAHALARLHQTLARQLPRELIELTSASDDLSMAVARVSSGVRPPVFLVLDVRTATSLAGMQTYPRLKGTRLAPVDAIEVRARDGLVLRGYLTTPLDEHGKPRSGLPLIVTAHDGPLGEATDFGYEFERQLFASRGYAVLQINHRGSPGRGTAFERAGDGNWGGSVQNDYIDAVRWAIKDGVADPQKICFFGTGYGAYSALVAAAREPDLFRCVVGAGGVYDLHSLYADGPAMPAAMQQALGNDAAELAARSPVNLAARIKSDVLLVGEQRNDLVPPEQSQLMRAAMRKAGKKPQWMMTGQQYDGYFTPQVRATAYRDIMKFINKSTGR